MTNSKSRALIKNTLDPHDDNTYKLVKTDN